MEVMNDKEYSEWIGGIVRRYWQAQIRAATAVNAEMTRRMAIAEEWRFGRL